MFEKSFEFEDSKGKIFEIDEYDLVQAWNEYCEDDNDPDSDIWFNDGDFLDMFSKNDIACRVAWGKYSPYDKYITIDQTNGNFKSSSDPRELIGIMCTDDDFLNDYCAEYAKVKQVRY